MSQKNKCEKKSIFAIGHHDNDWQLESGTMTAVVDRQHQTIQTEAMQIQLSKNIKNGNLQ